MIELKCLFGAERRVERPAVWRLWRVFGGGPARIIIHATLLFACLTPVAAAAPQRIVSLNVCTDQILIDLVARDRIAAVTHLATDPLSSAHPERALGLRSTRGAAEDVMAVNPDLVIVGQYSTPATVAILRRLGQRVEIVPQPSTMSGVRDLIRAMAALVEEATAGEALIKRMEERITVVRQQRAVTVQTVTRDSGTSADERPRAIVYQVNNYVSGSGSLIDQALDAAGYRNGAAGLRIARNGQVSLEAMASDPPDVLVLASGPTTYRTAVADNLRHPILARLATSQRTVVVPWPLWLCGTHHIAEAVEMLAAVRRK